MHNNNLVRVYFDGDALRPDGQYATEQLRERLGAGEALLIDIEPSRSKRSHGHQFAFVNTAWKNLPEALKGVPYAATAETLRKHALIATGHCNASMVAVGEHDRAERIAALVHTVAEQVNGYAVTEAKGSVVWCFTPVSQSEKAMGKEEFQRSKTDILNWLADLIGVAPEELSSMGKKGET